MRVVSYMDWQKMDAAEIRRGETAGKPREKFTRVKEMLEVLESESDFQMTQQLFPNMA